MMLPPLLRSGLRQVSMCSSYWGGRSPDPPSETLPPSADTGDIIECKLVRTNTPACLPCRIGAQSCARTFDKRFRESGVDWQTGILSDWIRLGTSINLYSQVEYNRRIDMPQHLAHAELLRTGLHLCQPSLVGFTRNNG